MAEVPIVRQSVAQLYPDGLHVQVRKIELPAPLVRNEGPRDELFRAFHSMNVGDCIEVTRLKRSVQNYLWQYRKAYAEGSRFTVRATASGSTRIWRTA